MQKIYKFLISFFLLAVFELASNTRFVVLICSYNNKNYYQQNLLSLFRQDYDNWIAYYVDDCSTDGTYELAYEFTRSQNMLHKVNFIKNTQNLGGLANQYHVISQCDDRAVIVLLDGDDQLNGSAVLSYVDQVYKDPDVWVTYGSYVPLVKPFPVCCADISQEDQKNDPYFFRKHAWVFSHLRTFYAALFKKIKKEDFMYNGQFLKTVVDVTVTMPMFEMANGLPRHYKYLDQPLYVYNNINPLCEFRCQNNNIGLMDRFIRNKQPYSPINKLF